MGDEEAAVTATQGGISAMIGPGSESVDPVTQTRLVVLECDAERLVMETHCPPGAAPWVAEHVHMEWTETFEIVSGAARYKLDGDERSLAERETVVLPPGHKHVHPWNAGDTELVYRQTSDFGAPSPDAAQDVLGAFFTIHGLAREGKINKKGLPKNPLQFGATVRTLTRHGGYDAAAPIAAQNFVAATLGRVAEFLGYRGTDPRYLGGGANGAETASD